MALETALVGLFSEATTYSGGRTMLEINSDHGSAHLVPQTEVEAVPPTISFLNGKWAFGELIMDGETIQLPYGSFAFLTIDDENVSGSLGCNSFAGTNTFAEGVVNLDPLTVTQRMCTDEALMVYETALSQLLSDATSYQATGHALAISNDDGTMTVNLTPVCEQTLFVGAEQADCVGVAPQKCLLVKENAEDDYTFFYSNIIGFDWETGYEYELLIEVSDIANLPADVSSLRYELVEVVSKTETATE